MSSQVYVRGALVQVGNSAVRPLQRELLRFAIRTGRRIEGPRSKRISLIAAQLRPTNDTDILYHQFVGSHIYILKMRTFVAPNSFDN